MNVLDADLSRHLGKLHDLCSPNDKMELVAAIDDIDGGTDEQPILTLDDSRVGDRPRTAIRQLESEYMAAGGVVQ